MKLTKTYSGDLTWAIAKRLWADRQVAAGAKREALGILEESDDSMLHPGEFMGHAVAKRMTSMLPRRFQHQMPDLKNSEYLHRGQKRTIMSPFASPINPQPTKSGPRGGGGINPDVVPHDSILGNMINITPGGDITKVRPNTPMVGSNFGSRKTTSTKKPPVNVKDEKLGKFLAAVAKSLSASVSSLNERMDETQEGVISANESLKINQQQLEDGTDTLGDKLDLLIAAVREQNRFAEVQVENKKEAKKEEQVEEDKDRSNTIRTIKVGQDDEEVAKINREDRMADEAEEANEENRAFKQGELNLGGAQPFERGGYVARGPDSGYPAILHGDEAVIPMDNKFTRGETPVTGGPPLGMAERGRNPDGMDPTFTQNIFNKSITKGDEFNRETQKLYSAMEIPFKTSAIVAADGFAKALQTSDVPQEVVQPLQNILNPFATAAGVGTSWTNIIASNNEAQKQNEKKKDVEFSDSKKKDKRKWWDFYGKLVGDGGPGLASNIMRTQHGTSNTAANLIRQGGFKSGTGMLGHGVYSSVKPNVAQSYSGAGAFKGLKGGNGQVLDMLTPNTARTFRGATVTSDITANKGLKLADKLKGGAYGNSSKANELRNVLKGGSNTKNIVNIGTKAKGLAGGLGLNLAMDAIFPDPVGSYQDLTGPNAFYNNPKLSEEERLAAIASLNPPGDRNNTSNFINLNSKENVFTKLERANAKVEPIIINRNDTSGGSDTQVAKNIIGKKGNPWKAGTYVTNY